MFSSDQVEQYRSEGYTVLKDFLSREDLDQFLGGIDRVTDRNTLAEHDSTRMEMEPNQTPDGTLVRRIYEPCTHYDLFHSFSESEKLLDCIEQLFGPNLFFHYSKINMKPPGIGSPVEWHQDLSYYPLTNRDSVSILFYLDDTSMENGCLQIIPRKHASPLLSHSTEGYFRGKVTVDVSEADAVPIVGSAGTAIFMNAMTPHASVTNASTKPRRTLILSYRAADAFPVYAGEMTHLTEQHSRLVRGNYAATARFTMSEFPVPLYESRIASLYDLQGRSCQEKASETAS